MKGFINERRKNLTDKGLYHLNITLNAKANGLKNVYKKSLAIQPFIQSQFGPYKTEQAKSEISSFVFTKTPEFIVDFIELTIIN